MLAIQFLQIFPKSISVANLSLGLRSHPYCFTRVVSHQSSSFVFPSVVHQRSLLWSSGDICGMVVRRTPNI